MCENWFAESVDVISFITVPTGDKSRIIRVGKY